MLLTPLLTGPTIAGRKLTRWRESQASEHMSSWCAGCRLAQRWGMTNGRTVEQTEADLKLLWPEACP